MNRKDKIKLIKYFKMYLDEADEVEHFEFNGNVFHLEIKNKEEKK